MYIRVLTKLVCVSIATAMWPFCGDGVRSQSLVKLLWELENYFGRLGTDDRHPCRKRGVGLALISSLNPNPDIIPFVQDY